jgi:hypothetical protein
MRPLGVQLLVGENAKVEAIHRNAIDADDLILILFLLRSKRLNLKWRTTEYYCNLQCQNAEL